MLKGSRKYWVIALICGIAAAFLTYQYLQDVKSRYQPDDLIQVVRAKGDIKADTIITRDQIVIEKLPAKFVHQSAVRKAEDVIGKVAISAISAQEIILKPKLLSAENASRLAYSIPESKRAVTVAINSISGVAGYIQAGDRVDIIATLDIPVPDSKGGETQTSFSILTLQDIEVLAVGNNPGSASKNKAGESTLTLAVSVEEARPLVLASERGNLRLLLRSPVDHTKTDVPPYQLKDFLQ